MTGPEITSIIVFLLVFIIPMILLFVWIFLRPVLKGEEKQVPSPGGSDDNQHA